MTYSELQSRVADWLHRSDMDAVIPGFIALAEARMNRHLRVRQMEVDLLATTIIDNKITPAADVVDVKSLWIPGYEGSPLKPQPLENVIANGYTGIPTSYAWRGTDLVFDGAGDVTGVLYERIPALSDTNTTNWLLSAAEDVYLFGTLIYAAQYTKDDPTTWQGMYDQAVNELQGNDQRRFGKLVSRAR